MVALVNRRVTPSIKFAGTHLYTRVVRVKLKTLRRGRDLQLWAHGLLLLTGVCGMQDGDKKKQQKNQGYGRYTKNYESNLAETGKHWGG